MYVGSCSDQLEDTFAQREALLSALEEQIQNIVNKQITLLIYREIPGLGENDQSLVDATLKTISQILQLAIIGMKLGKFVESIGLENHSTKGFESLRISIMSITNFDENGICWLRTLVKAKNLHSIIETLLLFMSETGLDNESRFDAVQAQHLLSHRCDLISLLSCVKSVPLKFDVNAPID